MYQPPNYIIVSGCWKSLLSPTLCRCSHTRSGFCCSNLCVRGVL